MYHRKALGIFVMLSFLIWANSFEATSSSKEPSCEWYEKDNDINVICHYVSNVSTVEHLLYRLSNYSIGKLHLDQCLLTNIPSDTFQNATILKMIISSPLEEIADDALESIQELSDLKLYNTKFSLVPTAVKVLYGLKKLQIRSGELDRLDDELQNMSSLVSLSLVHNMISQLSKDAFVHTQNLDLLDLSYNNLKMIHPDTLDPLVHLRWISLAHNQISFVDGVFKKINPQAIFLSNNMLTSVDEVLHLNMWQLKIFDIGGNPIKSVNSTAFRDKTTHLENLIMNNVMLGNITNDLFQQFLILRKVDLSYNKLTYLPNSVFQSALNLHEVILKNNGLNSIEGLFRSNPKITTLDLSGNNLVQLGNSLHGNQKLVHLKMFKNKIEYISSTDFHNKPYLEQIWSNNNKISRIDSKSFSKLQFLKILTLSNNKMERLNGSLKGLTSLIELTLQNCNLKALGKTELTGLPNLNALYISSNYLGSVHEAFTQLDNLRFLHLGRNKLITLTRESFPKTLKLNKLWLAGNKWKCDCRMLWFKEWMIQTKYAILQDNPRCNLPYQLRNMTLKTVTVEDLNLWPKECPDSCQCRCVPNANNFYVSVDCSNKQLRDVPKTLPKYLGDLNLKNNFLNNFTNVNYELLKRIEFLNLENNTISEINFQSEIFRTLKIIRLEGNQMTHFPMNLFTNHSLEQLTLSRNAWICDCNTLQFRNWLISEKATVKDINETRCGLKGGSNSGLFGRVIISLSESELCPSSGINYVAILIGALGLLLVATSLILLYLRYSFHIRVWLYAHGVKRVKEEDLDTGKQFDAFVSYSQLDQSFVMRELIPKLENEKPNFSLCIPERDIVPNGRVQTDDHLNAVTVCKRTIVVLSEHFLQDGLCMQEFMKAFAISVEEEVRRVIVVKYGELESIADMDQALKSYIDSNYCWKWGDNRFWEKMRYAMPKKSKPTANNGGTSVNGRNSVTVSLIEANDTRIHQTNE